MRINIPGNPDKLIQLAQKIQAKHTADAAASPLNGMPGIATAGDLITRADDQNKLSLTLASQAEKATEARDNALGSDTTTEGTVKFFVTAARDVLLALNKGREHALGDWGFDVTSTARPTDGSAAPAAAPAK